jgi:hypothetical protein
VDVLQVWPRQAVEPLAPELTALASRPDASDDDLTSMELLLRHGLVDRQWLKAWVVFRRKQAVQRRQRLEELERQLEEAPSE